MLYTSVRCFVEGTNNKPLNGMHNKGTDLLAGPVVRNKHVLLDGLGRDELPRSLADFDAGHVGAGAQVP